MPTFIKLIQCRAGSAGQNNQARERKKRHQNWNEAVKASLLADNDSLYIKP